MNFQPTWEMMILLFGTGLAAGFVDSIAGGGGLLALPMILSTGMPPRLALGTNKFQGTFGTLSASWNFIRKGTVNFRDCYAGMVFTLIGATIGTCTVQRLDADFIRHIVPPLLLGVLVYTFFAKNLGRTETPPKMKKNAFFVIFGLCLGFYDGFFGPGTGSFWMAGFCILLGFDMTKSAGHTRVMNFTSNIVSLSLFIAGGNVLWQVGICMAAGQLIGARIGSGMAIKNGAAFIRPLFMTVVAATVARLIYTSYF